MGRDSRGWSVPRSGYAAYRPWRNRRNFTAVDDAPDRILIMQPNLATLRDDRRGAAGRSTWGWSSSARFPNGTIIPRNETRMRMFLERGRFLRHTRVGGLLGPVAHVAPNPFIHANETVTEQVYVGGTGLSGYHEAVPEGQGLLMTTYWDNLRAVATLFDSDSSS